MKEFIVFPRDPDSLKIIKELEEYLKLPHKSINQISYIELAEYINQLTLELLYKNSNLD